MAKPPPDPVFTLRGHQGSVTHVNFATEILSTAQHLLSSSDCGELFIWDLKTYRAHSKHKGHNDKNILWTDSHSGRIFSQGRDGNLCVWQILEGNWTQVGSKRHDAIGFCQCSLLKNEGSAIIACPTAQMSAIDVLDASTMKVFATTMDLTKNKNFGMCMCCKLFRFPGSHKTMLVCGFENRKVALFSVDEQCLVSEIETHRNPVMCLDVDPEFRGRGISGSVDNELVLWGCSESEDLTVTYKVEVTNPGVTAVAVRNDGKIVCTAGSDYRLRVFSWKTMKPLAVLSYHNDQIHSVAFSSKTGTSANMLLAAGSRDRKISIWSLYN